MPAQLRNVCDLITTEIEVVETERSLFDVKYICQLIVCCLDAGEKFETVQVFESIQAVVG